MISLENTFLKYSSDFHFLALFLSHDHRRQTYLEWAWVDGLKAKYSLITQQ